MTLFKAALLLWLLPTLAFLTVAVAAHPAIFVRRVFRRLFQRQSGKVREAIGQPADLGT